MPTFDEIREKLKGHQRTWLITGVAGFIGSHLLESILNLNQHVIGIDNLSSGSLENLAEVEGNVPREKWRNFQFIEADLKNPKSMIDIIDKADFVLHQAATSSVELCSNHPAETFANNTIPLINILTAARGTKVKKVVFASSAAVYGNPKQLPVKESDPLSPISLYGLSKKVNEEICPLFETETVGLRYFNVYGRRQSLSNGYAGVISIFKEKILKNENARIYGDGNNSRDFIYIEDIVRANLLAALSADTGGNHSIFNIGTGKSIKILELLKLMEKIFLQSGKISSNVGIHFCERKPGDISESLPDVSKARNAFHFECEHSIDMGLREFLL